MLQILPDLTKEYILTHISQEEIFQKYLGVPVDTGDRIVVPSVLRNGNRDSNPSGTFKWSGHKLRFRDWAGYFWGDCFDLVGTITGINPNSKVGFMQILDRIAMDFGIHKYTSVDKLIDRTTTVLSTKGGNTDIPMFTYLHVETRKWNKLDAEYWTKYYIYKPALDYFYVVPCMELWKNNELVYRYNPSDPAYAYDLGKDKIGRQLWKIYFPYRSKKGQRARFIMNSSTVEGLRRVKEAEVGIITKSYKDIISLHCVCGDTFSITAIAPSSENVLLPADVVYDLWVKCDYLVSLMDFDFQGKNMAWKLKTIYNVRPLFLTNGALGTTNYGSKDFSDYVDKEGRAKAIKLIESAYKYVKEKFPKK